MIENEAAKALSVALPRLKNLHTVLLSGNVHSFDSFFVVLYLIANFIVAICCYFMVDLFYGRILSVADTPFSISREITYT